MIRQRRRAIQGATIRDVAARAGVSPMTVSRVINAGDNVRSATRELVYIAIRELNYVPSPAARSLAGSAACRFGLLYDNPSSAYLSEFLLGTLDESSHIGAQVLVEKCADAAQAGATLAKLLRAGVDGLILPPPLCESPQVLALIRRSGTAAVAVAGHQSPDLATVRIDNQAAARELTEHLLQLGHRTFGFIQGHPNQSCSGERLKGFRAALAQAGLPDSAARIEPGYFTYRSGLEAAERLLASGDAAITAIVAANDDMAAATAALAHRRGYNVPGDLSIVGFDDTPIAVTVWPALTTIHQPVEAMARAAIGLLLQEIRRLRPGRGTGRGPAPQLLMPHTLKVRESSGPAPLALNAQLKGAGRQARPVK